jgi:hypothetical protein
MVRNWAGLFEFEHALIEAKVKPRPGSYPGLMPEALYTSFEDLEAIMLKPQIRGTWVDLGAGVGFSCLMYGMLFPDRKAIGIEWESARVEQGLSMIHQLGIGNVQLQLADLMTCEIPQGDTYFLYFPTGPILDRILAILRKRAKPFVLVAIESHGDLLPRLGKEHWLRKIGDIPLKSARHHPTAVMFEGLPAVSAATLPPHELSFQQKYLIITEEHQRSWLGDSFGLEWLQDDCYQLLHPPRTIHWNQVREVLELQELTEPMRLLVELRRGGELKLTHDSGMITGELRKIMLAPVLALELSDGQLIEWRAISSIQQGQHLCYDSSSCFFSLPPADMG